MINPTATSPIPQARVLVVDDEAHVRSALARSLSLMGYSADDVASGHQALETLERASYDAMVLDILCWVWMASRSCSAPLGCVPT